MKFERFAVCALIAALSISLFPEKSPAASKEIQELQREMAGLADQLRQLKESQDRQMTALTVLVQQALDTSTKSSTGVAVIQSNLQQTLTDMQTKMVTPVAGLNSRMDGVDQGMRAVQQSVMDLAGSISKLQQQITDLNHAVAILQVPAPPPPAPTGGNVGGNGNVAMDVGGGRGSVAPGLSASAAPEPCPQATQLYADANRDRGGGKFDLAMKEYSEYIRCYSNSDLAPNAQFYIGSIHAAQSDFDSAVRDFDVVLEKYPDNPKTKDALYSKGLALKKLNRLNEAAAEFAELIKRDPKGELGIQACDRRKEMGLNCGVPARGPAKGKKK